MLSAETFTQGVKSVNVSNGDNLHEMTNPVFLSFFSFFFLKNEKNITNLSSAELAMRVVKV